MSKTIYIDAEFKCHLYPGSDRKQIETAVFDRKCDAYIEGYRFVPAGDTWVREDGVIFHGLMIAPWKPWAELDAAQREYERRQYQEITAQNAELLDAMAALVDEVYEQDLEIIGE